MANHLGDKMIYPIIYLFCGYILKFILFFIFLQELKNHHMK